MKRAQLMFTIGYQKFHFYLLFFLFFLLSIPLAGQTAINDYFSTYVGNAITINPLDNDSGCENYNLSISISPVRGILSSINPDGSFTYTPNNGFAGKDSLKYTINCNGNSNSAWVYFIIAPYPDNILNAYCYTSPEATQWGIRKGDSSSLTSHICAQPFVGDIDNDGQNEVVVAGHAYSFIATSTIVIYDHRLVEKASFNVFEMNTAGGFPMAIADVDKDGIAEIFVHSSDGKLRCYNFNGINVTTKWISIQYAISNRTACPVIADVNADGIPDILIIDKIFNAQTGELEVTLPVSVGEETIYYGGGRLSMPVFADIDNDGLLEAVGGNIVMKVNITNPHGTTGNNAYIWKTLTGMNIGDGPTSVADIDLDGFLDVIVVRKGFMYVWKPYTGFNSTPSLLDVIPYYSSNNLCGSKALIGDFDNDGYPEIAWTYAYTIHACKYNAIARSLETLWIHPTTDNSGSTVMSVFDFNQDGSAEIIYRDRTNLRILNGVTGLDISTFPCASATGIEYPVIVDLDKDGAAEIIVSETHNLDSPNAERGRIRSFTSLPGVQWAPARPVWNQYSYNVVHINDDLTVPQYQFNPVTPLINPNTPSIINRPFNNFLQQATTVNQHGEPFIPVADIAFVEDSAVIRSCDSIQIKLLIRNSGSQTLKSFFKITAYKDRYQNELIRVDTISFSVGVNENKYVTLVYSFEELNDFLPVNSLVFAVNDGGTGIAQYGGQQAECDASNNIFIIPFPSLFYSYHNQLTASICQGKPYNENGFNIPAGNTQNLGVFNFRQSHVSIFGCDSIIDLELTVLYPRYDIEISDTSCHAYEWNGIIYDKSGRYTQHLTSSNDCDSIVHLTLTIGDTAIFINDAICKGDAYKLHGFDIPVQETEGDYRFPLFLTNLLSCDSIIYLDLKVIDPIVSIEATDSLLCKKGLNLQAKTSLQYLMWNTGATEHILPVYETGVYYVTASEGRCTAVDSIIIKPCCPQNYLLPNVITPSVRDGINDYFCLPEGFTPFDMEITIFNRLGRKVFQSKDPDFKWYGDSNDVITTADYFYVLTLNKECRFQGYIKVF